MDSNGISVSVSYEVILNFLTSVYYMGFLTQPYHISLTSTSYIIILTQPTKPAFYLRLLY